MKIVILVSGFPPHRIGGTENATFNIAKTLADKGHSIYIITSKDGNFTSKNKFSVHPIKMTGIKIIGPFFDLQKILSIIKEIKPELIHAQGISTSGISGFTAFLIYKFTKIPYIVYGRGGDIYPLKAEKFIVQKILKNAASVIALTKGMKEEMLKIHNRNIEIIPNGINLDKFKDATNKNQKNLNNAKNTRIILFVGNLRRDKGVKYLIHSMKFVISQKLKTKLLIVGDGPEKKSLEKITKQISLDDVITFKGRVSRNEVPEYMLKADMLVLPSPYNEGFPNVILEAMAAGLPIISTNIVGMDEIIEDGVNGFLVEPKRPDKIAEKISSILENDTLRLKISKNNIDKSSQYSWKKTTEQLEKIYIKTVNTQIQQPN